MFNITFMQHFYRSAHDRGPIEDIDGPARDAGAGEEDRGAGRGEVVGRRRHERRGGAHLDVEQRRREAPLLGDGLDEAQLVMAVEQRDDAAEVARRIRDQLLRGGGAVVGRWWRRCAWAGASSAT